MKKVKLNLTTIHTENNQEEKIEYNVDANMMNTKEYTVFSYIDPSQNENDRIIIKCNEDEIRIIRQGTIKSEMIFKRKEGSHGHYEVEGLILDLQISLKYFLFKDNLIKIDYDLFIDNHYTGLFNTVIKIDDKI